MNKNENDGKSGNDENDENNGMNRRNKRHTFSYDSHSSQTSHHSHSLERVLPPRGDYRNLLTFQKAEVIYDITFRFCHKFLPNDRRTIDQMVQAARSGKQNIIEGSKAGTTSKESEIKLTNVARASMEELLEDYRDYLRVRDRRIWDKDSKEALAVRELGRRPNQNFEIYREIVETRPDEVIANLVVCLLHQVNYLLDRQLQRLEKDFVERGGLRERMTRARLEHRDKNS